MSSNWPTVTIQELIDDEVILVHKDGNHGSNYPRTGEFGKEGVPFLTAKLLDDSGNIDLDSAPRLSTDKANKFRFGFIEPNDVLLSHNATVGRVAVVPDIKERMLIGTSLTHYRLDTSRLLPKYLAAYFSGISFQNQLASVMSQTTRNQVPITSQRTLSVVVPPIEEQKKIAGMLGAFDDKIQNNAQTNQTLEQMAQAIFKSWFVDFDPVKAKMETLATGGRVDDAELAAMRVISAKTLDELNTLKASNPEAFNKLTQTAALFPSAMQDSELGEIPDGWEVKLSGEIMDVRDGTHDSPKRSESGYPLVTSKHITTGVLALNDAYLISEEDYLKINKRSNVSHGDILLTMIGTVGIPYLISQHTVNFAIKNIGLFRTSEKSLIRGYFFLLLKSEQMQRYLDARMAGTTQKYLSLTTLRTIEVLLPPDEILVKFNICASTFFEKIFSNVAENEVLSSIRDSLLPKLLSGELVGE